MCEADERVVENLAPGQKPSHKSILMTWLRSLLPKGIPPRLEYTQKWSRVTSSSFSYISMTAKRPQPQILIVLAPKDLSCLRSQDLGQDRTRKCLVVWRPSIYLECLCSGFNGIQSRAQTRKDGCLQSMSECLLPDGMPIRHLEVWWLTMHVIWQSITLVEAWTRSSGYHFTLNLSVVGLKLPVCRRGTSVLDATSMN
jgi:hypothetical protein